MEPSIDFIVKQEPISPSKFQIKTEIPDIKLSKTIKKEYANVIPDIEDTVSPKIVKWEPKNWQQTLNNIREMRQSQLAPVDTMGCHKCSDDYADEKVKIIFAPNKI